MPAQHLQDGTRAEQLARRFLETAGLSTLCRNYRCRPGEIDLIMLDEGCLVIVEVRYRRSVRHGGALWSISQAKRHRIVLATRCFLSANPRYAAHPLRFDVIALTGPPDGIHIDWRKQAFDCSD